MRKFFLSIARLIIIPPVLYILNKLLYNEFYYSSFSNTIIQNIVELLFILVIFLLGFIQFYLIIQILLRQLLMSDSLTGLSDYIDSHPVLRFLNVYKHQTIHISRTRKEPFKQKDIFPFYSFKVLFFGGFGLILEGDFLLGIIVLYLEIKTGFLIQIALPVLYNYEHLFYLLRTDYTPNTNMDVFLAQRLRLIPRQRDYDSIKESIYERMNTRTPLHKKWTAPKMSNNVNHLDSSNNKLWHLPTFYNRYEVDYRRPAAEVWPDTYTYDKTPFTFTYDHVKYRAVVQGRTFDTPKEMWDFCVNECVTLLITGEKIPSNTTNAILNKALYICQSERYEYKPKKMLPESSRVEVRNNLYYSAVIMRAIERKYDISEW